MRDGAARAEAIGRGKGTGGTAADRGQARRDADRGAAARAHGPPRRHVVASPQALAAATDELDAHGEKAHGPPPVGLERGRIRSRRAERLEKCDEFILLGRLQSGELRRGRPGLALVQTDRIFERAGPAVVQVRARVGHAP